MSSWVDNQRQEAFLLYKRYLGIDLHFKDGTGYDYTLYNGATKATLSAFLKKPRTEILKFVQLNNRLRGLNQEEFLFANARYENLDLRYLMSPLALKTYNDWKVKFGEKELFLASVYYRWQTFSKSHPDEENPAEVVIKLLGGDDDYLELIAYLLQGNPEIGTYVRAGAEANIFSKIALLKALKIQKFYSYFCII